jgi:hypothetical protein
LSVPGGGGFPELGWFGRACPQIIANVISIFRGYLEIFR